MYCELMQYILKVGFLTFNHKAVNLMFLENLVRYNAYFIRTPGFTQYVAMIFFSESALLSRDPELA